MDTENNPFSSQQAELSDANLVRAIIAGQTPYATLRQRAKNPLTAARFFASVATSVYPKKQGDSSCDICDLPGFPVTIAWSAQLLNRGEHILVGLLLLPIVLLGILFGGFVPEPKARADHITFQTHHFLCQHCQPSLLQRIGVTILDGLVCLLALGALAVFLFSVAILIGWWAGAGGVIEEIGVYIIPCFILSLAFLLSLLSRWPRKVARTILLTRQLRGLASGPFELEKSNAFRLTETDA